MKIRNLYFLLLSVSLTLVGCNNNEDIIPVTPPRPLAEVQLEDDEKIQQFLATNFYNYEEFENPPAGFDFKIKIDSIFGDNANKRPLSEFVRDTTVTITFNEVGIEGEGSIAQKLYYLIARKGGGGRPTIADSVFVRFNGRFLDKEIFQPQTSYEWSLITDPIISTIRGFKIGMTKLNAASNIIENNNGTFDILDSGIGLIIFPSSLGYYNRPPLGIPLYSPLIFEYELAAYVADTDTDRDGVPSILEDLNGNGDLNDDNTDLDIETPNLLFIPNYADADDDGDGIPTRDEIVINEDGSLEFPDTDGDGIPDYLDRDSN